MEINTHRVTYLFHLIKKYFSSSKSLLLISVTPAEDFKGSSLWIFNSNFLATHTNNPSQLVWLKFSCIHTNQQTWSLSSQKEKNDDTSWYFKMNLGFHYQYPAAGEEEGENIWKSLDRQLIFYFSNIPTS